MAKTKPPVKKKIGHPKRVFDAEKLRKLKAFMRMKPTLLDTAAFFECGQTTVEAAVRDNFGMAFREFRQQNMVHTRMMLIRTALQKAERGDNCMLIFCLKNLCGWADQPFPEDDESIDGIEWEYGENK